jgi:glycosyltransferase involved in cell wall biosynthesis
MFFRHQKSMIEIINLMENKQLSVFTWHIHGTYLYYLSQGDFRIYIPVTDEKQEGYYGRGSTFPFGDNVIEVPASEVKDLKVDCILFQTNKNWLVDQYEILSEEQRRLPRIYLEHDPPAHHPTDTRHVMNDPDVIMVHVTDFNKLMWHNNSKIIKVIDHGVISPKVKYTGNLERGIVVVNHLHQRGRKLGSDIFTEVSRHVPLDLIGMGTKEYGGLGEVLHPDLPEFISHYRFFFNPIRYTSLGLAVIEAMMVGLPVVALATTEYATMFKNYETGFAATDVEFLIQKMQLLLINQPWAANIGARGKKYAQDRFDINRFADQWKQVFQLAITKDENYEKENCLYK